MKREKFEKDFNINLDNVQFQTVESLNVKGYFYKTANVGKYTIFCEDGDYYLVVDNSVCKYRVDLKEEMTRERIKKLNDSIIENRFGSQYRLLELLETMAAFIMDNDMVEEYEAEYGDISDKERDYLFPKA